MDLASVWMRIVGSVRALVDRERCSEAPWEEFIEEEWRELDGDH